PSVEEFARRYPEHADEVREMLPALVLMERAKAPDSLPGQQRHARASAAAAPLQQLGRFQREARAAARVSASVVRERIVPALDRLLLQENTAGVRAVLNWLLRPEKSSRVRAVLRLVDADPYRDAVRDAVLANDGAKVVELAGQQAALEQPPG